MAVTEDLLSVLTRIADALDRIADGKAKKRASAPAKDLFGADADRRFRGLKPEQPMPEPFEMSDKHRAFAAQRGFDKPEFMFDQFKAHHRAKGSKFASWDGAWQTWVLNQMRFSGHIPPSPRAPGQGSDGRL